MTGATPTRGLGSRMVNAALWLVGSNVSSQALRLISSLVLTRLLRLGCKKTVHTSVCP